VTSTLSISYAWRYGRLSIVYHPNPGNLGSLSRGRLLDGLIWWILSVVYFRAVCIERAVACAVIIKQVRCKAGYFGSYHRNAGATGGKSAGGSWIDWWILSIMAAGAEARSI
jgi:hypothetical protein